MFGMGTILDIKNKWTIDDLFDAHEALDIKDETEAYNQERLRRK